jgi:3-methyladenine DNA glycosylase/8-oxoguanine DNA glycosylase
MVGSALRPFSHVAAWILWHSMRVSLLRDLEHPQPPYRA